MILMIWTISISYLSHAHVPIDCNQNAYFLLPTCPVSCRVSASGSSYQTRSTIHSMLLLASNDDPPIKRKYTSHVWTPPTNPCNICPVKIITDEQHGTETNGTIHLTAYNSSPGWLLSTSSPVIAMERSSLHRSSMRKWLAERISLTKATTVGPSMIIMGRIAASRHIAVVDRAKLNMDSLSGLGPESKRK
jgi:hypothetical protein